MPGGLSAMPRDDEPIVASLIGTGTRSLMVQLGLRCMRHFNMDGSVVFLRQSEHEWHVPVQCPYLHMVSRCQKARPQDPWWERVLSAMDVMIELTTDRPNTIFYPTHTLTEHEGVGAYRGHYPGPGMAALSRWMTPEREQFYRRFYI